MNKQRKGRSKAKQFCWRAVWLIMLIQTYGQTASAQIHIKSVQGVGLGWGISDLGHQTSVHYTRFLHRNWHLKAGVTYEQAKVTSLVDYRAYGIQLSAYRTIYDFRETLFLNLGASAAGSYEQISKLEVSKPSKGRGLAYGLGLGGMLEYYISPKLALTLGGFQYYRFKGLGSARYQTSFGVHYFLH